MSAAAGPLVSIVVPAYNHAAYLREALDSILDQDYPHLELIAIDDGSTDETRRILETYTGRFHWESQANQGQVATLNRGWTMSRGDVLGYLSADDILLPGAVTSAVRCLDKNPDAVLTYCDFNQIDPHSAVVRRVVTPDFDYRAMAVEFICPPGPGAFFRRWAFARAGLWDTQLKQMLDYDYWLRLGLYGHFVRIPAVLAAYRVHPGSQTFASSHQIRPQEPVTIVQRYFDRNDVPGGIRKLRNQALSNAHLQSASLYFGTGSAGRGISALGRAFRLWPSNLFTPRTLKLFFNVIFYRIGHRALWLGRAALKKPARKNSHGGMQ
jgi:glycosyltransferase involved in cell wall biosynthesis